MSHGVLLHHTSASETPSINNLLCSGARVRRAAGFSGWSGLIWPQCWVCVVDDIEPKPLCYGWGLVFKGLRII